MQFEPNARQNKLLPTSDSSLQLVIEPEPWLRIFLRNMGDLFRREPPPAPTTSQTGQYWADAQVFRPAAWAFIADSFLAHIISVAAVYTLTLAWLSQPVIQPDELVEARHIENYQVSEYLPAVNPQKPEPPRRPVAQKADPAYAPQEIVSIHIDHRSNRQTIVNPVNLKLLSQDTPLPNIVVWTPAPAIAPVSSKHALQEIPLAAPSVVPPMEQPAERKLNALEFPLQPKVVAPAEAPASRNLSALDLPAAQQAAVPPSENAAQRRMGDVNLAFNAPTVEAPSLPVPEQKTATSPEGAQRSGARPSIPPVEPVTQGTARSQAQQMGRLLVANIQPAAPAGPVIVPEGNRQGEFAAGPTGHPGASGQPEIARGGHDSNAGTKGNNSPAGSVFIASPPAKVPAPVVVSAPAAPAARAETHNPAIGHAEPPLEKIDNQVFGDRKSYAMALNMPNLTSSVGSSWIIRFAEINSQPGTASDGLSAPVALSKVDPAYPPALVQGGIEGTVILYAVIHRDGTVGDVKVLQSVDGTLDENARDALQKWHFRPGTRNGSPVDLEAVIRIPFRAPRRAF